MWAEVDSGVRKKYEKKEAEDKARYEREMAAFEKEKGAAAGGGGKKKKKA
eukprot:CAMPEP_0173304618 /NCGR_PEP_ID=MMETSP1143-20121109/19541_1 /TAXON_ID=483371 /ORGANISM="non described non described, Strain CCMP2298" /LENGTH=49 /DNA_ID=CAMNT_0014245451 /DNA_START=60 /DNA_END=209 /DNA_ORIENTATION=+